jgi:hypothetical protein
VNQRGFDAGQKLVDTHALHYRVEARS